MNEPDIIQAQRDLELIKDLEKSVPFQQYFMRRFNQRLAAVTEKFKYELASKCPPHQREAYRQTMLALEELGNLMNVDRANCIQTLERAGKKY